MAGWNNFFFAQVGASAALVGLIFVAVSINLTKILAIPHLPNRALEALAILVVILIVASLALVPEQSDDLLGIEILVIGVVIWLISTWLNITTVRQTDVQYVGYARFKFVFHQLVVLPYIFAGISLISWGLIGLYWLVPAIMLSYIKALTDAWVLLVEINR